MIRQCRPVWDVLTCSDRDGGAWRWPSFSARPSQVGTGLSVEVMASALPSTVGPRAFASSPSRQGHREMTWSICLSLHQSNNRPLCAFCGVEGLMV